MNLPDIADKMAKTGVSKETILEIIEVMTGLSIKEIEKKEDKVLAVGRYMEKEDGKWDNEAAYQVYAKNHGCLCYYNVNYDSLIEQYKGYEKMDIANIAVVTYCAKNNWDFIFVTDPHYYVEENFISKGYKEKYGGGAYSMEISIIRKYGYVNFVNSNVTWASIIASPLIPNDVFALAGYRISR